MIQHLIFSNVCVFYDVVGWELLRTGKREKRNTLTVSFFYGLVRFVWRGFWDILGVPSYLGRVSFLGVIDRF